MKLFKATFVYTAADNHSPSTVYTPSSLTMDKTVNSILAVKAFEVDAFSTQKLGYNVPNKEEKNNKEEKK
mgnify:CR=1 FL=1